MCEKAAEIQSLRVRLENSFKGKHNWINGDYSYYNSEVSPYCVQCDEEFGPWSTMKDWIFLPRQDQLQDMIGDSEPEKLINGFISFVLHSPEGSSFESCWIMDCYEKYTSLEQLWLVYVMMTKYNKTWEGHKWIVNA